MEPVCASLPSAGIQATVWRPSAILYRWESEQAARMLAVCLLSLGALGARCLDWVDGTGSGAAIELGGGQHEILTFSLGTSAEFGEQSVVFGGAANSGGLAAEVWLRAGIAGNFRRDGTISGDLLSSGELDSTGCHCGTRTHGSGHAILVDAQDDLCLSVGGRLPLLALRGNRQEER
jgi:hypothetical protein